MIKKQIKAEKGKRKESKENGEVCSSKQKKMMTYPSSACFHFALYTFLLLCQSIGFC